MVIGAPAQSFRPHKNTLRLRAAMRRHRGDRKATERLQSPVWLRYETPRCKVLEVHGSLELPSLAFVVACVAVGKSDTDWTEIK